MNKRFTDRGLSRFQLRNYSDDFEFKNWLVNLWYEMGFSIIYPANESFSFIKYIVSVWPNESQGVIIIRKQ